MHGWDDKMSLDQSISGWASTTTQEATTESCSLKAASVWGTKNTDVDEQGCENHVLLNQAKESSDWNKKSNSNQTDAACGLKAASSWGAKNTDADKCWGNKVDLNQADTLCSWGRSKTPDRGWGVSNSGGSNGSEMDNKIENQSLLDRGKESGGWGTKNTDADKPWSHKVNLNQADTASGCGKSKSLDRGGGVSNSGGGNGNVMNNKTENQSQLERAKESGGWGAKNTDADNPWGNKVNLNQADTASSWGKPKSPDRGWGLSNSEGGNRSEMDDKTENQSLLDRGKESGGLGEPKSLEISQGWGSSKDSVKAVDGWGVPNSAGGNGSERDQQWGQQSGEFKKNRSEGSQGWGSNNGDWKKRNHPSKPHEDSSSSGLFTTTRQRLGIFTSQEQDILTDVEPLMLSIRRIMHQTGYNDGDPLSADDQSYVLDNVFNYHPDKAVKMGAGINHVIVSRHSNFQERRCFYIVSTDDCKQDFSYRKCLENFIRGKYPDLADEFIGKYFARRGNRQRTPAPEGTEEEKQATGHVML